MRPVTRDEIVANLEERHQRFFQEMGINQQTGIRSRFGGSGRRFVCHPYVGSQYGESTRILFVGQDVGKDPGHLQSFEERRRAIEDKPLRDHNAHIAGTFCVALSLLPPEYGWGRLTTVTGPVSVCCDCVRRRGRRTIPCPSSGLRTTTSGPPWAGLSVQGAATADWSLPRPKGSF